MQDLINDSSFTPPSVQPHKMIFGFPLDFLLRASHFSGIWLAAPKPPGEGGCLEFGVYAFSPPIYPSHRPKADEH
jgi:hypothetical protein